MTCPPDAFRSGTDVTVLRPGARWTGAWGLPPLIRLVGRPGPALLP